MKRLNNPILVLMILLATSVTHAATTATMYLMTPSISANITNLHIINSSDTEQNFTGTLYNGDGEMLGSADTALTVMPVAPNQRLILNAFDIESLFGVSAWKGPAMLEVKGSGGFELLAKLQSPSGLISNTNCVTDNKVHNIDGFDSPALSFIRIINTLDIGLADISGTLFDQDGNVIGLADAELTSPLDAKQQLWLNRNDIAALIGSDWTGTATLEVDTVPGLKLLNLNFVNNETFFNFSCFESSSTFVASIRIPDELLGVWTVQEDMAMLIFAGDGSYYGIKWPDTEDNDGIESGTFETSGSTLVTNVTVNHDGDGLICGDDLQLPCDENLFWSVDGDVLNINNEALLDRENLPGTDLVGVWRSSDSTAIFIFQEDLTYFAIQDVEENGFVGFERGTYLESGGSIIFETLQNNDGQALTCSEDKGTTCSGTSFEFTINQDILVINDETSFTRLL